MWIWNAITVGLGVLTLIGVYYTKKQVDLIRQDSETKKLWAAKHAEAFALVSKTQRDVRFDSAPTPAYNVVFPDSALRQLIGTYIANMSRQQDRWTQSLLDGDSYCYPIVQDTITKTLEAVQEFKKAHPEEASHLGFN